MGQKEHASSLVNVGAIRLIRAGFADSGMTQDALARSCGIPRSTLANILSPSAAPRLIHVDQLVRIAVAIGVDPRTWIGELESLERQRGAGRADEVADRRTRGSTAPQTQKRAARSRSSKPRASDE